MPALTLLNQSYGWARGASPISTVGVVPGILELAERPEQFRLAVSLHAPNEELRQKLVPLEKKYPLPELMARSTRFEEAGGRRITFEYVMIAGVNDELEHAASWRAGAPVPVARQPDPVQPDPRHRLAAVAAGPAARVRRAARGRRAGHDPQPARPRHRRGVRPAARRARDEAPPKPYLNPRAVAAVPSAGGQCAAAARPGARCPRRWACAPACRPGAPARGDVRAR
jgi:hypothetical protein